ncbi:MAG: hypothetical protein V2A65_08520 [Candidatus Omnitrophota bacterium]
MKITRKQKRDELVISNNLFSYRISKETAGFPSEIAFSGDSTPLMKSGLPLITARVNGRAIRPCLKDRFQPEIITGKNSVRLIFDDIGWQDEEGNLVKDYRLALHYETYEDGVVFVKTFFFTKTLVPGPVWNFIFQGHLSLKDEEEANWAYWTFPKTNTAELIQAMGGFERNLKEGERRVFPKTILPFVSFDFGVGERRDRHLEYFVESYNSLSGDYHNTETDISWSKKKATVTWNFQKKPNLTPERAYQWSNTWGWALRRFPEERKHPPFRIYHYFDNFARYPTEKIVKQAASQGANLFILHENWRFDIKNGEFADDRSLLKRTIRNIHKYGMRTALYVRGNEDEIKEDCAGSLTPYLKKDWDGIYMDFGSPVCFTSCDESSPGGKIAFRLYYHLTRKIRESVGEDGIFLSHSGSFFSAVGHTTANGYVSGEQEKGQLIKSRTLHAYFSGISVSPSTLWTAAFPTYRTKAAIPYLATAAQSPFINLGTQMPASSLDHPDVPSVITFQRPLWRLWGLFEGKKNIHVYSTYNSSIIFTVDSDKTGACLLVDDKGDGLLIVSNFSAKIRGVSVRINWKKIGLKPGRNLFALDSNYERNRYSAADFEYCFSRTLDGFGVTGWLFANSGNSWKARLAQFASPYVAFPTDEARYRKKIESIRKQRFEPPSWKRWYLRVVIPNYPNSYEDSLWWDLFDNAVELREVNKNGSHRSLGYVSAKGLARKWPEKKDYIRPGIPTPWIPLHKIIKSKSGDDPVRLCLATRRQKKFEFYSFVQAELSPVPGPDKRAYQIVYNNEIDSDWSHLDFNITFSVTSLQVYHQSISKNVALP